MSESDRQQESELVVPDDLAHVEAKWTDEGRLELRYTAGAAVSTERVGRLIASVALGSTALLVFGNPPVVWLWLAGFAALAVFRARVESELRRWASVLIIDVAYLVGALVVAPNKLGVLLAMWAAFEFYTTLEDMLGRPRWRTLIRIDGSRISWGHDTRTQDPDLTHSLDLESAEPDLVAVDDGAALQLRDGVLLPIHIDAAPELKWLVDALQDMADRRRRHAEPLREAERAQVSTLASGRPVWTWPDLGRWLVPLFTLVYFMNPVEFYFDPSPAKAALYIGLAAVFSVRVFTKRDVWSSRTALAQISPEPEVATQQGVAERSPGSQAVERPPDAEPKTGPQTCETGVRT